jgi:hypothetical protein
MIKFFLLFSVIVYECNLFCQSESFKELTGFRNSQWGSSVNEVKSVETGSYVQSFEGFGIYVLSYKNRIADLMAWIDYTFKDGKLIEGSYSFEPAGSFKNDFNKLKIFLITHYGKPDFRAGPLLESDSIWIKVSEYSNYKGPELYWQFSNGFTALIASKFEDEITITILYSSVKSIEEYNRDREVSVEDFF